MYFGGVSDAQMRVRCSIGMHERKKQNENKNIFALYFLRVSGAALCCFHYAHCLCRFNKSWQQRISFDRIKLFCFVLDEWKDVVEQLTIRDGGITRITRTVHPNDVMDIVVVGASGESTTSTARSDYSLFYEIYQDQQNYKNGQLAQIPALTGSDVTGSQFKHRYVGTSATDTVYASDLRKCKKASDVASILATAWGSTPAAVISSTASFIFDQMLQSMSSDCYKVTISSITYEVLFSYDNSYYTHCYHQTVKEYKSNGSLIRSKTDYYQAIGG